MVKSLREATCDVMRTFGVGVLDDSRRCLSALADLIDGDSAEAKVLYDNCDERLLSRYSKAAQARSRQALETTYGGTVEYLVKDCYVGEEAAKKVAAGLARGIADALGFGELIIEDDGNETLTTTPPPSKPLSDAVHDTLRTSGVGILGNSVMLNKELAKRIDSSSDEARVLSRYGDDRLYAPFVRAVEAGKPRALADAQKKCATYLQEVCGVHPYDAQRVADGLARGIVAFTGWTYPPEPGTSAALKVAMGVISLVAVVIIGVVVFRVITLSVPPANPVTISFNANGADSGAVDPITCEMGEAIPLPSGSGYVRDGYTFAGWGDERSDDTPYGVGETYSTSEDVTLYAQWNLGSDSKITVAKEQFFTSGMGNQVVVLTVNNTSSTTVDLQAKFSFLDSAGTTVDSCTFDAWSVGPGETTILEGTSAVSDIQNVSYDVRPSTPQYSGTSILTCATVEEVSCNDEGLKVRVTNKGDKRITLVSCVAYGYDEGDSFAYMPVNYEGEDQRLDPGESRTVAFDGAQWMSLGYKVYLYGFAG